MKIDKLYFIFALLFVLLLSVGFVAADNMEDSGQVLANDSSVSISDGLGSVDNSNSISKYDSELSNLNSQVDSKLSDSNEIVVNDWDELKHYCSLNDKNYVLKLKENTNFYPNDPSSDENQIVVKNNVTIIGSSGAYIGDSSPNPRSIGYTAIKVEDKSGIGITLQGIVFKWISSSYSTDGVFLVMGGNVNNTIKNCVFDNITTSMGHSSILHLKWGDALVDNCTFTNCTTDFGCISIYCPNDDATKLCTNARMVVRDSYFQDNYAKTEPGCINNCGVLTVYNTTFYKNSAFWWAGAIHTHGGANTTIYYSDFIDNLAGWNGGALYTYSYLQIYNSTFVGNNCTTNNGGGAIGACKYLHAPYIYIENSLFKDNENKCWSIGGDSTDGTGRGGAISTMNEGLLEVRNTTFIHNSASMGSAIAAISGSSNLGSPDIILVGNRFINHTRSGDVLYIYVNSNSNIEIHDNVFDNSTIELNKFRIESSESIDNKTNITLDISIKNPVAYDKDVLNNINFDIFVDGVFYKRITGLSFTYNFEDDEIHTIYATSSISSDVSNTLLISNHKKYIYVSKKFGNDNNDGASDTRPVATLAKAISLANGCGNIYILDGTFGETGLNVNYDLEITGLSNVIISNTQNNVFTVNATQIKFNNMIFSNLRQTDDNRIISSNGLVIFDNCKFNGGSYKKAIEANEIKMTNTVFDGISVENYLISSSILNADNVFVINNRNSGKTTGLFDSGNVKTWDIQNSKFENNYDLWYGCIHVSKDSSSKNSVLNLANVSFIGNKLHESSQTKYTTCIYTSGVDLNIISSIFVNNVNTIGKTTVIYMGNTDCNIKLNNSIFLNNTFGPSSGGYVYGSSSKLKNVAANYNWFGNNVNDLTLTPTLSNSINYNGWFLLNASSDMDKLDPDEKTIIYFDLNNIISKTGVISYYDASSLPEIKLKLNVLNGILNTTEVTLVDGKAKVEFTKIGSETSVVSGSFLTSTVNVYINGTKDIPDLSIDASNVTAGDDLEIKVNLPSDATGELILTFNGENYTLDYSNGIASKTFNKLEKGHYTIFVNFKGDSKYFSSNVTEKIVSSQIESNLNINVGDIYVNDELKVLVSLPSDATGNVSLKIGDMTLNEKINNGEATFSILNLPADNYLVEAYYVGNIKYLPSSSTKPVSVLKYNSTTSILRGDVQLGDDVVLTINVLPDAMGNVTLLINNIPQIIYLTNGKASYTINNIVKGDYDIKAIYNGDNKYLSSEDNDKFSVGKLNSNVFVEVSDIDYGENATVEITVPNQQTGYVTVLIDDKKETAMLVNGKSTINISNLSSGTKDVVVIYEGDEDYLNSTNTTMFTVNKINPKFNVIANSIIVGGKVTVSIDFEKTMTGSFTLAVGDLIKTLTITRYGTVSNWELDNLNSDDYQVNVVYSGDNNYNGYSISTSFTVFELPIPQVSNEGLNSNNTGKSSFETNVNGKILFTIGASEKINGSIVIDAEGNIYFAANLTLYKFNHDEMVWNYSSSYLANSLPGVTIGRDVLISTMPGNNLIFVNITSGETYGHSNIYQGSSYYAPVIDDDYNIYIVSELIVSDNQYKLVIIPYSIWFNGGSPVMISLGNSQPIASPVLINKNRVAVVCEDGLKIVDIENENVVESYPNIVSRPVVGIGDIVYALSGDSIIAIGLDGQMWKSKVTGPIGQHLSIDSENGYIYSVNDNGVLYKYDSYSGDESLVYDFNKSISSKIMIDNEGNLYLGSEDGIFYALDNNGNLMWKINLNGKIAENIVLDENGVVYVIVNDSEIIALGHDELSNPKLSSNANNITFGDDLAIEISFDKDATGTVTIEIDNKVIAKNIVGNEGKFNIAISGLSVGNYTALITYSGDSRFDKSEVSLPVKVSKIPTADVDQVISVPDVSNSTSKISYGINLSSDATGNLTVTIGGKNYTSNLTNGHATVDIPDLASGNYNVVITYSGDNNHESIVKQTTLFIPEKIDPHVPDIKLTGSDVVMLYTNGAVYQVRLTGDGVGLSGQTVVFVVNGKTSRVQTDGNGYASVKIDLPPKSSKYTVTATYNDVKVTNNVKVNGIVAAKNVKVKKSAKKLTIKVTLKKVNGQFQKSKKVTLKFKGKTYTAKTNKKGVATFKISKKVIKKLKKGKKYTYKVIYFKETVNKKITVK